MNRAKTLNISICANGKRLEASGGVEKLARWIWRRMKRVTLSLQDDRENVISFPAVYAFLLAVFCPFLAFVVFYALAMGNMRFILKDEG